MATEAEGRPAIPIFRFVGPSGSGKTTLLERVVGELKRRGLRVAVAKDTHHDVELDQPGKDTWRLARAGAEQVVLATDARLTLFQRRSRRPTLAEIAALVAPQADILLAEGFRDSVEPAVLVWRSALGRDGVAGTDPVVAIVADAPTGLGAPEFELDQVKPLVELLLASR